MPTYEYSCSKCGAEFECSQRISEPALTVCPKEMCPRKTWGKGKVKRKIGAGAGLIFKGSGFYITDYRSEGYKKAAEKDSAASKPATTESKPAASSTPASTAKPGAASTTPSKNSSSA